MIINSDYNNFSTSLAKRFVERCSGSDFDSARILNRRPSDHVLAGFLTPVKNDVVDLVDDGSPVDSIDSGPVEDLTFDSSYEQTSLGLEWVTPIEGLSSGETRLSIEITLSIFLRRLPEFEEQEESCTWTEIPGNEGRFCNTMHAWTRHEIPTLMTDLDLSEFREKRHLGFSFAEQLKTHWSTIDTQLLYPGRQNISFSERDIGSKENFKAFINNLGNVKTQPVLWNPCLDLRIVSIPTLPHAARLALRVINKTTPVADRFLDFADHNLYSVRLSAEIPNTCHQMTDFQELPASFRYNRKMWAVGINCEARGKPRERTICLATDSTPVQTVNRLEPRNVFGADPTFDSLIADPIPVLQRILKAMEAYRSEEWLSKIASLNNPTEKKDAVEAERQFVSEIDRFRRGVELLSNKDYELVAKAFALMNSAMKDAANGKYDRWRLFQIVFIVTQIPALAAREYSELEQDNDEAVEILWFAAGGGKTEGFLGVILWQCFFDRLRGKKLGVTAFLRFPLRLLAFQQLRRIAKAVACAEKIRVANGLGGAKFSIGDFSGGNVTPNSISNDEHVRFSRDGVDNRYQRIFSCPFCDSDVHLGYEPDMRLIKHLCSNAECPNPDRLPVYIVDDDLYRYLPTVIVSTVDKIALFGYNQKFANLFGRFDLVCSKHGASFRDINKRICKAAQEYAAGEIPENCGGSKVIYGPFHDAGPALMVQDELHLLSSALGAFDSHYETAVMQLSKSLGFKPWKIIAATATIKAFETHAAELYLKQSRQFPGPGPNAFDSFYYRQEPEKIGRIFIGVLGVGRKHTPSLTRSLSIVYQELQFARELCSRDISAANLRYGVNFENSAEFEQVIFSYELPLTYVLTRKGSDQVAEAVESRVKGELQEYSPSHGDLKVEMFNSGIDIAEMTATMERIASATPEGDPAERLRGLITTNIIGHGVDVDRFNIIAFAGFPRMVAEYVQASARVGRTYPGISILVVTPQNERDRSIFDRFSKFHEYLDRLVDPSAITRWTEPTVQRTLPGILAGYLMSVAAAKLKAPISSVEQVQHQHARSGAEALNESVILDWIDLAYGVDLSPSSTRYQGRLHTFLNNFYRLIINEPTFPGGIPRGLGKFLEAMRSLRDIDALGEIKPARQTDGQMIRRISNG